MNEAILFLVFMSLFIVVVIIGSNILFPDIMKEKVKERIEKMSSDAVLEVWNDIKRENK